MWVQANRDIKEKKSVDLLLTHTVVRDTQSSIGIIRVFAQSSHALPTMYTSENVKKQKGTFLLCVLLWKKRETTERASHQHLMVMVMREPCP